MRKIIILTALLIGSCAPKQGERIVEGEKIEEDNLTSFEQNILNIPRHGISLKIGTDFKWLADKTRKKPTYYFAKSGEKNSTLLVKFIDQKENKFAENLTKLAKTYEHLLSKWQLVEESIDRIKNKKSYYLSFIYYNDETNKNMFCNVYNIQINSTTLLSITNSSTEEDAEENNRTSKKLIKSLQIKNT